MLCLIFMILFGVMWLVYEITDPNGRWFRYFH